MRNALLLLTHGLFAFCLLAPSPMLTAAPQLQQGAIVNAASFAVSGTANAGIAQGSLFTVFGVDLGPGAPVNVSQFPLPFTLGGVSVRITAGGQNQDCPMIYVSNTQVSAILPSNVPTGEASLVLTYNGQPSNAITFTVVARQTGIFTRSSSGSGQAVIQNFISPASLPVNAISEAAQPGQVEVLWLTGLGASPNGDDRNPPATGNLLQFDQLSVYVGGIKARVEYAGRSGCCAGVDQINFVVPQNVQGCFVPVVVAINDIPSNFTSMAINPNGTTCEGAFGLTRTQLESLAAKPSVRFGSIVLIRARNEVVGMTAYVETGAAAFQEVSGAGYLSAGAEFGDAGIAPNSCVAAAYATGSNPGTAADAPDLLRAIRLRALDAGPAISINGSTGPRQIVRNAQEPGVYYAQLNDPLSPLNTYLTAGNYTLTNGGAAADIGLFNFARMVPPFLDWTNRAAVNGVNRQQALNITWTAFPASSGYVAISGFSASASQKKASVFSCLADPSSGTFQVPTYVLKLMVASDNGGASQVPAGQITVGKVLTPSSFTAPGLDVGMFEVLVADSKALNFQ